MRIESLRLKGYLGIKKGLGLDEATIDFRDVPGLVAFDGMNGSGKTTVLENLHPFPQLASREGALYHHCHLRDSEKELCFTYGGGSYRTLIKIDCQSEKQEGYIWKNGASKVNGKISAYSRYIKDLLGSPELFFASVFCAQNSKKLSDMTTGKLKELFAEFLRLDRLREWEGTARQCAAIMNGQAGQIDTRIAAMEEQIRGKVVLDEKFLFAIQKAELLRDDKSLLEHDLAKKRQQVDTLKEAIRQNASLIARRADLQQTIDRITSDMLKEQKIAEAEIEQVNMRYREILAELQKINAILAERDRIEGAAKEAQAAQLQIETLQAEIDRSVAVSTKHQETVHALEISSQEGRQAFKDIDNDKALRDIETAIGEMERAIADQTRDLREMENDRETSDMRGQIRDTREKIHALDLKDPACQSTTCSFIVSALAARDALPRMDALLAAKEAKSDGKRKVIEAQVETIRPALIIKAEQRRTQIEALSMAKKEAADRIIKIDKELSDAREGLSVSTCALNGIRKRISECRDILSRIKDLSARAPEITIAEARKQDLDHQHGEALEKGVKLKGAWKEKEMVLSSRIEDERNILSQIERQIDAGVEDKLRMITLSTDNIEKVRLPDIEREITKARDHMATIQAELTRMSDAEKALETVRDEKIRLSKEVAEWTYLRNACSKNGLQALEIDGTAPLITAKANELLSMAFGPLFTVKFRTQDEEGREVLDIISIGEDGGEVLLENLSGGQKIWILMALRLAMTLLSKEKSGRVFETAFFDEMDGPLDPDNSLNFIAMYQAFMKVGGFKAILFISHKPSCRNMADHILLFETGKTPSWR